MFREGVPQSWSRGAEGSVSQCAALSPWGEKSVAVGGAE